MITKLSVAMIVLLICSVAPKATAQSLKPRLFSVEAENQSSLRNSDVKATIVLDGAFAETTLELAYANSSDANIQGLFKIRLPAGALVRDFALKLGEKWQLGSLTEKHKARETFEEVVRRGLDPAVLAWKDGSEYQARIFPFPAKGKRWIRVSYWQDLHEVKDRFCYSLPLPHGTKLDSFSLKVTAAASDLAQVKVSDDFSKFVYMKPIDAQKTSFGAIIDETNFNVPGSLDLSVSQAANAKSKIWTAQTTPKGDMTYVAARWFQDLPHENRKTARDILVFMDTSRSARPSEPKEIEKFLKVLAQKTAARFRYYEFDASVRKVANLNFQQMIFDGGTNFKAVFREAAKVQKTLGSEIEVLILTDALPTMQKEAELAATPFANTKVFFLPTSEKFNPHFAGMIADKSGGTVLPKLSEADTSADLYINATWKFVGFSVDGGAATDVFPEPGTRIDTNEGAYVYFRTKRIPAAGTLTLSNGMQTIKLSASFNDAKSVAETEKLWAMKKLLSLVPVADQYEKELIAHATRYQLVSPKTSYLVLENDRDYQQFNITKRPENLQSPMPEVVESSADNFAVADLSAADAMAPMLDMAAASAPAFGEAQTPALTDQTFATPQLEPETFAPARASARVNNFDSALNVKDAKAKYFKSANSAAEINEVYNRMNQEDCEDAWFFIEAANKFAFVGEKDRAFRTLSNLFEISTEDGKSLRALGLVGCFQGNCDWAAEAFQLAIELRPEEPQNYRDLAWLLLEEGEFARAKATLALLSGKTFHSRFPGMDRLLARESKWIDQIASGRTPSAVTDAPTYSSITWNNDNSDIDFHIKESRGNVIMYSNPKGEGELSNDFTRGYGPEIYTSKSNTRPSYFVNYFRQDTSSATSAVVVKFSTVEVWGSKVKVSSRIFPLYHPGEFVKLN